MGAKFEFESDWKLFRERIPYWRERYTATLVEDYIKILGEDASASSRFWKLDERIRVDRKHAGVATDMRRSMLIWNVIELIDEGAIDYDDLKGFSDEFVRSVKDIMSE